MSSKNNKCAFSPNKIRYDPETGGYCCPGSGKHHRDVPKGSKSTKSTKSKKQDVKQGYYIKNNTLMQSNTEITITNYSELYAHKANEEIRYQEMRQQQKFDDLNAIINYNQKLIYELGIFANKFYYKYSKNIKQGCVYFSRTEIDDFINFYEELIEVYNKFNQLVGDLRDSYAKPIGQYGPYRGKLSNLFPSDLPEVKYMNLVRNSARCLKKWYQLLDNIDAKIKSRYDNCDKRNPKVFSEWSKEFLIFINDSIKKIKNFSFGFGKEEIKTLGLSEYKLPHSENSVRYEKDRKSYLQKLEDFQNDILDDNFDSISTYVNDYYKIFDRLSTLAVEYTKIYIEEHKNELAKNFPYEVNEYIISIYTDGYNDHSKILQTKTIGDNIEKKVSLNNFSKVTKIKILGKRLGYDDDECKTITTDLCTILTHCGIPCREMTPNELANLTYSLFYKRVMSKVNDVGDYLDKLKAKVVETEADKRQSICYEIIRIAESYNKLILYTKAEIYNFDTDPNQWRLMGTHIKNLELDAAYALKTINLYKYIIHTAEIENEVEQELKELNNLVENMANLKTIGKEAKRLEEVFKLLEKRFHRQHLSNISDSVKSSDFISIVFNKLEKIILKKRPYLKSWFKENGFNESLPGMYQSILITEFKFSSKFVKKLGLPRIPVFLQSKAIEENHKFITKIYKLDAKIKQPVYIPVVKYMDEVNKKGTAYYFDEKSSTYLLSKKTLVVHNECGAMYWLYGEKKAAEVEKVLAKAFNGKIFPLINKTETPLFHALALNNFPLGSLDEEEKEILEKCASKFQKQIWSGARKKGIEVIICKDTGKVYHVCDEDKSLENIYSK